MKKTFQKSYGVEGRTDKGGIVPRYSEITDSEYCNSDCKFKHKKFK